MARPRNLDSRYRKPLQSRDPRARGNAMKRIPAGLLATLLALAGCETAPPPAEPAPPTPPAAESPSLDPAAFAPPGPGTFIIGRRADGTLERTRVLGTDGYAIRLDQDGQRVARVPFCYGCGNPRYEALDTEAYAALWPLETGKTATFRRETEAGTTRIHTVTVTGTETLETEFGPAPVYVVREEVRAAGADSYRATRTVWYAPQLGWPVKAEWQAPEGAGSWEIAAMAVKQ